MKTNVTSTLLESIVELTSQRDQQSLQLCLFKTLQEFISPSEIALYAISAETGNLALKLLVGPDNQSDHPKIRQRHFPLSLDADPDLMKCLTSETQVVSNSKGVTGGIRVIHPVMGANGMIGVLIIKCASLIHKDQKLAASFLRIYHNYLVLIDANDHDTLTGLLNRKTFSDRIMRILSAQQNNSRRVSDDSVKNHGAYLAMLDIDHFKRVNDKFGHLYGDEVLLLFARLMKETFREDDQLYRYGGEEFVVVLKNTDTTLAPTIFERFRKKVRAFHFPQVGNITVSVGMVAITNQDLPTTVVEQADKALYYAKDNGRDQVCEYEKLLAQGKLTNIQSQGEVEIF